MPPCPPNDVVTVPLACQEDLPSSTTEINKQIAQFVRLLISILVFCWNERYISVTLMLWLYSRTDYALTLLWQAGHISPTYKESFQVRWDNSIPLFLHAAICLEVSLFRWTSQNAFSRETAVCKWYCVQYCIAVKGTTIFFILQTNCPVIICIDVASWAVNQVF